MPKQKTHRGLLKRIKVTGSGRIKMGRAYGRHLRSGKRAKLLRDYRQPMFAGAADVRRLQSVLSERVRSSSAVREERAQKAKAREEASADK